MSVPLICDSGTGYLKVGFANDNFPAYSLPAMVGRPMLRADEKLDEIALKDIMICDEVTPYRSMLELSMPLIEGQVKNWEDMKLIWDYSFKKMGVNTKGATIMMTEPIMNPKENRIKMAEIMFEEFGFGRFQIGLQALLPLFAEGLTTAMLLDSGDGVTHCIPVYEGAMLVNESKRLNIAGRHVTDHLIKLLFQRGYAFNSSADFETVREIKEKLCYVSADLSVDRKLALETTCLEKEYTLPDKSKIKLGRERFEAAEILFNPVFLGMEAPGCGEMLFNSINDSPIDIRKSLYNSILISGGTTMLPGFPTRLYNDVYNLYKEKIVKGGEVKMKFKIQDPARRRYNVFIGASFLSHIMKDKADYWITNQDWKEVGPRCLNRISETLNNK